MHVLASPLAALARLSLASAPAALPIRWDTPPACVDAARVPARVEALVGRGSAGTGSLTLGAERHGEAWRIAIVLEAGPDDGPGEPLRRTLEGRDCATLTEAVALVVAVHLDAVATAKAVVEVPPPPAGTPAPPARTPAPSARTPDGSGGRVDATTPITAEPPSRPASATRGGGSGSAPPSRARPRALASVAAAAEVGVQPRVGAAFELAGGVGWTHARVELGALASVGPDATSERLAAVGGRFRLFTGLVRGCGVPGRARVELPLCVGLELGDLRASGTGLRRPATVDAPWVAAVASARPQWSPRLRSAAASGGPRLALGALLDLVVPLQRHHFATREAGPVHAVDPVAVRLGLRVELRLP